MEGVLERRTGADACEGACVGDGGVSGRGFRVGAIQHGCSDWFRWEDVGGIHAGWDVRWWGC